MSGQANQMLGSLNEPVTTQANVTAIIDNKNRITAAKPQRKRQSSDYWLGDLGSLGSV
jgi:hypothetical protein